MLRLKTLPTEQSTDLEKTPEHRLWTAVIAQAITDATYKGIRKGYVECKHKAIAWLSNKSKDFKIVFRMASIDPDYAYSKIQVALQDEKFIMKEQQLKLLKDRRTPAQIKYEKKGFKLKF
tara:strand:+ start:400 stop:759 length:360 start_codon:yes stop_codon:yes gene_type:complete